ncbi:MAG: hypothetical protein ACMUJM_21485 [bacterium]
MILLRRSITQVLFLTGILFLCLFLLGFGERSARGAIGVEIDNANIISDRDMNIFTGGRNNVDYNAHGIPGGRGVNFVPPAAPLLNPSTVSGGGPATPMELYENQSFRGWDVLYTGVPSVSKNWPEGIVNIPEPPVAAGRCFPVPFSATLTPAGTGSWYRWRIVLQEKPHSDINLKIRGCIMGNEGLTVYKPYTPGIINTATTPSDSAAGETGRVELNNGTNCFIRSATPRLLVWACPGPYSVFEDPFKMTAIKFGGQRSRDENNDADEIVLDGFVETRFVLVGNFETCVTLKFPENGFNQIGEKTSTLHHADMIDIIVQIPKNNNVDIYLGRQSVWLEYNGIVGTSVEGPLPDLPWSIEPGDPLELDDYIK